MIRNPIAGFVVFGLIWEAWPAVRPSSQRVPHDRRPLEGQALWKARSTPSASMAVKAVPRLQGEEEGDKEEEEEGEGEGEEEGGR